MDNYITDEVLIQQMTDGELRNWFTTIDAYSVGSQETLCEVCGKEHRCHTVIIPDVALFCNEVYSFDAVFNYCQPWGEFWETKQMEDTNQESLMDVIGLDYIPEFKEVDRHGE